MRRLMSILLLTMLGVGFANAEDAAAETAEIPEGWMELKLELPKQMFEGTPRDMRSPALETPEEAKEREEPILVPAEAVNLALDKEVTSSDDWPIIGELELITDGDKGGTDGSFVELGPKKQWVQIDLEEAAKLHGIVVWHYHTQARVYRDVVVQVSDDPDFLTDVKTVFNNDQDNSSGLGIGEDKEWIDTYQGRVIKLDGIEAQYVRLYSNGNTSNPMNHYVEVEVWGVAEAGE